MINLIPPAGYRVLKQEYLLRVGASFGFLAGSIFLLLTATLIPIYTLTSVQIDEYTARVADTEVEAQTFADAEKEAENSQILLAQMQKNSNASYGSELIHAVTAIAPEGITFKMFSIQNTQTAPHTIQVQGVAKTREVLIRFKNALETATQFEKAEIPIADLAPESDLPFTITITLASTQ